jgi:nucleotide-binding universal stress UspA family protein
VNVLAWIEETGWEAVIDAVAGLGSTRVTLLHVIPDDVVEGPAAARAGLLGRRHPPHFEEELSRLTAEGAEELLAAAAERLSKPPAAIVVRTGRVEHEVVAAAKHADLLVLARRSHDPGPHSLGHPSRFVVDHAACAVLVVWPT